jgi:RNA polymerase sigma-70 factor (ECF subfamily)
MDVGLFEREFLPRLNEVSAFARRLCRDDHQTKDLVQDTMLKAFLYARSFTEGTNSRAWLFQICKNTFMNTQRRKKLEPLLSGFQENRNDSQPDNVKSAAEFSEARDPATRLPSDSFSDEVSEALKSIPPDCQTAIILCDMEGYSYAEVADLVKVPVGTIRSRIHRGRKALALVLGTYAARNGFRTCDESV